MDFSRLNPQKMRLRHDAGERSEAIARQIRAIPESLRSPIQRQMLLQHERGECIGCTRQGRPQNADGYETPLVYEASGYAAPPEYCDCEAGKQYERFIQRERERYERSSRLERYKHACHVLGLPASKAGLSDQRYTLDEWPVEQKKAGKPVEDQESGTVTARSTILNLTRSFALHRCAFWAEPTKFGLCLCGLPGVGKTTLIRSLEPIFNEQGYHMLTVYAPDLLVLLEKPDRAEQIMTVLKKTEILFLDDVGDPGIAKAAPEWVRRIYARIFDERYRYQRLTLLTSNLNEERLELQMGPYVFSRLRGLCAFFTVPGIDMR
ncbi:IstB-like ATP binding protein [Thermosporothrix hazakensis]|jgi:hypothetical protein|uniref:IstB-like ATP binding protein n=2 Tax=Thermosporothrix TaxID=768650 RepID=A0A326UL12_THEHA|nr:AAA family ATPase [Thermosporothrix hazakensis]PZW29587.1 IstB-like ATP binding protein [Thermosporothrix hazakensis]BBH85871.1 hypothetical protein KTC_06220 [Thermosporothrix sp. COM3]GCE45702.1 hypothetical protein KTH_05710 [Thermosporothrix hazakensis]